MNEIKMDATVIGAVDAFYDRHRGGSGNVIVVTAISLDEALHQARIAIFSCIETAEKWADALPDGQNVIFAPYVVDEPDYGNAVKN